MFAKFEGIKMEPIIPTYYNEKELLQQVSEGDEQAFGALFHHHWDHIYTVAVSITRSAALSEDLVQDIFLKIWLNRTQLTSIEHFDNYLFIIARNAIYTSLRQNGVRESFLKGLRDSSENTSATTADRTPEEELLAKESKELIHEAFLRLSPQQQAVYRLSREGGLKYEEIAEQLGIAKSTVRNHMVKALQTIREHLRANADGLLLIICLLNAVL
jgi:RNA polymerase sigma-70 factor (family 1)